MVIAVFQFLWLKYSLDYVNESPKDSLEQILDFVISILWLLNQANNKYVVNQENNKYVVNQEIEQIGFPRLC